MIKSTASTEITNGNRLSLPASLEKPQILNGKVGRKSGLSRAPTKIDLASLLALFAGGLEGERVSLSKMHHLTRLGHLLKTMRVGGVSITVLHAMLNLHSMRQRVVSLKDLAVSIGVTTANITHVADCLEHLGIAKREISNTDRRQIHISLTPDGQSFVSGMEELFAAKYNP